MPLIRVSMVPGRTEEQKRAMVEKVTDAFLETCGGHRDAVWVMIEEVPAEHWATGAKLISDR